MTTHETRWDAVLQSKHFQTASGNFRLSCSSWVSKQRTLSYFSLPENVNSCYRLPYFNTSCCYWKSVVTDVFKGKVKWCGWNFDNLDFLLAVAWTTDWLVAFMSRACYLSIAAGSLISHCIVRWDFNGWRGPKLKIKQRSWKFLGGPKSSGL